MKKNSLRFINIILTTIMVLNSIVTPQMAYALSDAVEDDVEETNQAGEDGTTDVDTEDAVNEGENADENSDAADVHNVDSKKAEEEVKNEPTPEAKEEIADETPEDINNNDPPVQAQDDSEDEEVTAPQALDPSITTFSIIEENLINNFSFTIIDTDNNRRDIENGQELDLNLNELNALQLNYELVRPEGITLNAGDTYTIDLPSIFKGSVSGKPIEIDGITVAHYDIVIGQVNITFNENVENFDKFEMNVDVSGSFNTEVFETQEEVVIEVPYSAGDSFTATIRPEQQEFDKQDRKSAGSPYVLENGEKIPVDRNPTHIDWTVHVNEKRGTFENAKVVDDLGENLKIVEGSFIIERIRRNYNNEEIGREVIEGLTPTFTDSGFELIMGSVEDAYEITYTTTVKRPDGGGTHTINNDARIILNGVENKVSDKFDGTWSGDLPGIIKEGSLSEERADVINWTVEYNYGKETLGEVELTDVLTHGEIITDSVKVFEVHPDVDGLVTDFGEPTEGTFPLSLDADEKAYYITFSSTVPVGLQDTVINTISDNLTPQNSDDASVDVNTIPTGGKVGEQYVDEDGNPYIEWTITMNSGKVNVPGIEIRDVFDSEYLKFDTGDATLFELYRDGDKVQSFTIKDYEHSDSRTGFLLNIFEAGPSTYKFVYRTYYTTAGMQEPQLANQAELVFLDGEGIGIGDPIGVDYDQNGPKAGIEKSGKYITNKDNTNQEIEWTITFNNSKILLENPLITDVFTSKNNTYIPGSLGITSSNNSALPYDEPSFDENGFKLQFKGKTNAEYTIKYRTTVDDTNNLDHTNNATLTWQGGEEKADAKVTKRDPGIYKNADVVINEDGLKSIDWRIGFNTNKNILHNVIVTDKYSPSTATVSNIKLFRAGVEVDSKEYSITDTTPGKFTVEIAKLDAVPYQITYTTTLSPEEEKEIIKNLAEITYTGGEQKAHKNVLKPTLGVSKQAKNLNKDAVNPIISWQINANTDTNNHYVNLVNPVLTDTIPEDQRLVKGSVEVVRADNVAIKVEVDQITETDNSFVVNLPDGPYQWIARFDTEILEYPSVNAQLDRYTNSTTLSNANYDDVSANAHQDYHNGEDSGLVGKSGEQNPDTENIDWEVTINEEGLTINNPQIKDRLSDKQTYLTDTVKVMNNQEEELAENSYTLEFDNDNLGFTLTFSDNVITEPVKLSYSTRLNPELIGNVNVTNSIKVLGGQENREIYTEVASDTAQQWFYGGGGSGKTLQFELNKETPNGTPLEDVEFTLQREDFSGNIVGVDIKVITDENGVFLSGENLRAGRYILTEVRDSTPEGYQTLEEPIYFEVTYATPEEEGNYTVRLTDSEWETSDYANVTALGNVITVVNDYEPVTEKFVANKELTGQELVEGQFNFELLDLNNDVVIKGINKADGTIEFEEQSFNSPGTYNYKIREVNNELGGVTYDTSVYNVQVIITEGDNGLVSKVNYLDGSVHFKNFYQVAPITASIEATKLLNGQDLTDGQFTFELIDSMDNILTASNNAEGKIVFETIEYTEAGTYTYTLSEVDSGQGGMVYDDTEFEVTINVTDDGNGQLDATVTYPNDTTPVFTNNYAAESGSIVLEAQKVLEGRDLAEDDKFEFQLIGQDDDFNETVSSDVNGDIVFSEINYNTSGEYNYTIQEVAGALGGIEYDETVQNVTVTVIDNGEGQLVAEATYDNGEAVFTNTYTTTPTEATVTGEKILEGQALAAEQFTFELYNAQGHRIDTTQNDAEGQFAFETQVYDTPGEYNYTIREEQGALGGITYDNNKFSVTVSVVDNGEGQLEATVNLPDGPVSFTNNYEAAPDSVVLEAEKILEGQILRDRQFAFELVNESDEVVQTASNNKNGQIIFGEISYDKVGTYTYAIREKTEELGGITQDPTVYSVTVEVTDNSEGQLIATPNYNDGPAVFTNTYEAAPDSVVIEAYKHLEGQELVNNQFTFELIDESGEVIDEATNNINGQIIFDEIKYEGTGSHTYIVREVKGVQGGMTYDESQFVVVVTVEDNNLGNLVAGTNYIGGVPVFINSYETTPDSVVIEANKVLTGQDLRNDQFEFELVDHNDEVLQTKENNAAGQVIFDEITYNESGEYHYTIREVEGTQGGVTYDEAIYNVVVSVKDDREGTLTAEVQYVNGPVEFNNIYIPAHDSVVLEASKVLEGQDLRQGQFKFELVDDTDSVLQTVSNNSIGQIIFDELEFDTVGTYDYTIREVKGVQGGMTYDDSLFSITVEVTDDGEGQLHAIETYAVENVQFTNIYTPAPDSLVFEATKALEGQDLRAGQFEFDLLDYQGETLQTVTNNANGQIIFDERIYEAVGEYAYTIVEKVGTQGGITYDTEKFEILVTVTDDGEGQLIAVADFINGPVEFSNTYLAELAVVQLEAEKILEGKDLINNQFTFEVVDVDGEVAARGTNDVAGNVTFEAMEFTTTGTYEYTIREVVGDNVNMNYDRSEFDVVIEVTDDGEGQLHATVDYVDSTPIFENTFKKVSVGDYVWIDENKDGLQDETDIPLAGVVLVLKDEEGNIFTEDVYGNPIEPQVTDENGYYTFDDLPINKQYTVEIDREASKEALKGLMPTLEEEGDDRADDSSTWSAESIFLTEDGQRDPTLDFGFVRKRVSVGDYVWIDENDDGLQDETDTPLEGVKLILKDENGNIVTEDVDGNPIEPQITDENGYYSFDNLPADRTYTVEVDQEAFNKDFPELAPTQEHAGDNDLDSSTWTETSRLLTEDGESDPTLDFGFIRKRVSVGDYVWFDKNKDGLQDEKEPGIPGVVLVITDEEGNPVTDVYGNRVEPTTTDKNGRYSFDDLPINNRYIVTIDRVASVEALRNYVPTQHQVGGNHAIDSSTWIAISEFLDQHEQRDSTLDFGFVLVSSDPQDPRPTLPVTGGQRPEDPSDESDEGAPETSPEEEPKDGKLPTTGEAATYTLLAVALLTLGGFLIIYDRRWGKHSDN